ncbi:MAG: hemolysin family protein [bacterium]|nr:hemolysin family protein [bacterium]
MDTESSVLLLVFLVILSGYFSASETALTSLSYARVRTLVEQKKTFSNFIARLKAHPDRMLITILIGSNLVNVWASVMATKLAEQIYGDLLIAYVVGVMTLVSLILGEIIPKTLAQRFNVPVSQFCSPLLLLLSILLYPFIYLLELMTRFFIWSLGKKNFKSVTEDEVIAMLNIGHEEGEFNKQESEFIQNIFEFSDTTAEEIMVVKSEIEAFSDECTLETALKIITRSTHSRFPVYDQTLDHITGYVTIKDLIKESRKLSNLKKKLKDLKQYKILFFPVTKPINQIFRSFQQKRVHIAIILDEFGSAAGLVTIEDVLEEIVGDIVDESDVEVDSVKKTSANVYHLEANTTLDEIFEHHPFEVDIPTHRTVAFLILKKLGAFPREGEKIILAKEGVEFVVEKMDGKRIDKVRMQVKRKKNPKGMKKR